MFFPGEYTDNRHSDGRKKHYCLFCEKWLYKIRRHYTSVHKREERVKEIMKFKDKHVQRYMFSKLRGEGDFIKNMESLKDDNIAITAAKSKVTGSWLPCTNCMVFYSAKTLRIHVQRCNKVFNGNSSTKEARLLFKCSASDNDKFKEYENFVTSRMKSTEYTNLAKSDDGLLLYGYCLYEKHGDKGYHCISNAIRNVAHLLIAFRSLTGNAVASSLDLVEVKNYNDVVEATSGMWA